MPGVRFVSNNINGWDMPVVQRIPVGNSLSGNDNSTAGQGSIYNGDWMTLTSNTAFGTNAASGVQVLSSRKLTYKDIITNTLSGGILGYSQENYTTDPNGRFSGVPSYGLPGTPIPFAVPNPSSLWMQDPTSLRNYVPTTLAGRGNVFASRITPLYTTAAMGPNLNNTLAGIGLITGLGAPVIVQANFTTATTGGTVAAGTYYLVVTYTNALGETNASNVISVTTTGTTSILTVVASGVLAAFSGQASLANIAVNYKAYVGTSPTGPFYLQGGLNNSGTNLVITAPPVTNTAVVPPSNTTGQPGVSQFFVDPGAATKPFMILEMNISDPLYGTQFAAGNLNPGPEAVIQVIPTFAQLDPGFTGTIYNY